MSSKVYVIGVGMTKFEKPFSREWDYPDMAREAGTNALDDAGISYDDIEQAIAAYCRGEAGARQVEGATTAIQHNIGLGGAAVVTVYRGPA